MKVIKKVFATVLIVLATLEGIKAQSFDSLMYKAYVLNSHSLWESALEKNGDTYSLQKAIAFYGILNNTMTSSNEENFDQYVDPALEYLEAMEENGVHKAEAMALRSSIYGFIMAYSPWQGIYYGRKSSGAIEDAMNANSRSSIVNMVSGTSFFYTPETFGGDKAEALKAFDKAVKLYEEQEYAGWLYLNTLGHLGQAYAALGRKQEAIATYEKALEIDPDFNWISQNLLPKANQMKD